MLIQAGLVAFVLFIAYLGKKYVFTPNPPPPLLSPRRYEFVSAADSPTEIATKWEKPYHTLPVHVDIPRLGKKISIYVNNTVVHQADTDDLAALRAGAMMDTPRGSQDHTVIRDIVVSLSKHLGEAQSQQDALRARFSEFFHPAGDPSLALSEYLEQVVGVDSKVLGVLKACNQSILAPGVLKLKCTVGNQFAFKDMRGSWRINIYITPDKVCVTHLKRERSFEDDPADYFEFEWSLVLVFDGNVTKMQEVHLHIDELLFGTSMNPSKKKKIREAMSDFAGKNKL